MSIKGATKLKVRKRYLSPTFLTINVNKQDDIYAPSMGNFGDEVQVEYDFNFFGDDSAIRAEKFYGYLLKRRDSRDSFTLEAGDGISMLKENYVDKDTIFGSGSPVNMGIRNVIHQSPYYDNPLNGDTNISSIKPVGLESTTLDDEVNFDGGDTIHQAVTLLLGVVNTNSEYVSMWSEPNTQMVTSGGVHVDASGSEITLYSGSCPPSNNIIYTSEILEYEYEWNKEDRFSKVVVHDSEGNSGEYPKNQRLPYGTKRIKVNTELNDVILQAIARHYYKKYRISSSDLLDNKPSSIKLKVIPIHTLNFRPGDRFRIYIDSDEYYDMILYDSSLTLSNSQCKASLTFGQPKDNIKQIIRQM